MELFVSNNYESRFTAFNQSESGIDALYAITNNIVGKNVRTGHTFCTDQSDKLTIACDEYTINSLIGWPSDFSAANNQSQITYNGVTNVRVEKASSSSLKFSRYTLRSVYDDADAKGGKSESVLGILQLNL